MKYKAEITLENIVASATLSQNVDLKAIAEIFSNVEYRPDQFPGLVFRLRRPQVALLIFNSGRIVCTGAKSLEEVETAVNKMVKMLKTKDIISQTTKATVSIQNIVASIKLNGKIDLERSATVLGRTLYEPEQFPGLIYRMDKPKVVFLLFTSGRIVCTGARSEEEIFKAVSNLCKQLEQENLINT